MSLGGTPRVSIVVPTYNAAPFLESTVRSILGQTTSDFELILFDDGSTDRTVSIAQAFAERDPRVRVVTGDHRGIAASRNRGFAATNARSEFVTFFDHDDLWEADALETLMRALDANPECVGAHGLARCIDAKGELLPGDDQAETMRARRAVKDGRIVPLPITEPTTFWAELVRNYVTTPGTSLVRRSVLEAVGGFEAATEPCDDWDMILRICRRGDLAFVDKIVLNWRRLASAASQVSTRWRSAYVAARRRSIDSSDNTEIQRKAARYAMVAELGDMRREALGHALRGRFASAANRLMASLLLDVTVLHGVGSRPVLRRI
jgi:glycosyltransferase involved in cell wall biosynthesis